MYKLKQNSLLNPQYDENVLNQYKQTVNTKCFCGKNLRKGDVTFTCMTCSNDVTTVFCHDCFMNSSHDGHLWHAKNTSTGQCDCGDSVAFKPQSFCSQHPSKEHTDPFENMTKTEITTLLLNCFGLVASVHENKGTQQYLKSLEGSDILETAISIVVLLSGEIDITLEDVVDNISNLDFLIRVGVQYDAKTQESFFGKMCLIENPNKLLIQLYGEILPSCYYFRVAGIRQIGPYASQILNGKNEGILNNLIQTINEPLGLYHDWGFCDMVSDAVFACCKEYIVKEDVEGFVDKMSNIQSMSFVKCLTTWRSILFKSKKFLANCVKMQQLLIQQFSLNPNEQVIWSQDIVGKFVNHMYFYQILFADRGWVGFLKIGENADAKLLTEAHIKINNIDASLLQQQTYDHLINQAKYMLEAYLETFIDFNLLDKKPLQTIPSIFVQQFIVDVAVTYNIDISFIIQQIICCSDKLNEQEIVQMLVEPIVRQNLWFLFVENNLMHKQNLVDFGRFMQYFEQDICNKMPQYNSYFVVSKFLQEYPNIVHDIIINTYQKQFSNYPILFVDYISILNFIPRPEYNQQFLKKIIVNQEFKSLTLTGILSKGFSAYYTCEDVYAVLQQLFAHAPSSNPNDNDILTFNGFTLFEPVLFIGGMDSIIQKFTEKQNKFFVPECIYKKDQETNNILQYFDTQNLQNTCDIIIEQYNNQQLGLGQCLMAVRILLCQNQSISKYTFRQPELCQILQQELKSNQTQTLNPKERLQKLKQSKQIESKLMDNNDIVQNKDEQKDEILCEICHQKIENNDFVMPCKKVTMMADSYMHDGVQLCYHHYHKRCSANMKKCNLCGFECDYLMSFNNEQELTDQILVQLEVINYFIQFKLSPAAERRLQNEVQKLQLFLQQYNGSQSEIVDMKEIEKEMGQYFIENFSTNVQKTDIPDLHLPKSSFYVFKTLQNQSCKKCTKKCTLFQKQNPLMCLSCKTFSHFECAVTQNKYSCPDCSYPYCLSLRTLTLFHSASQVIKAPYKTKFGQYNLNIFDDESICQQQDIDYFYIQLCCGDSMQRDPQLLEAIGFTTQEKTKVQHLIDLLVRAGLGPEQLNNFGEQEIQQLLQMLNEEQNDEGEDEDEDEDESDESD
ncbi:Putative_zinc finger in N-recognin (UBR box) and ring finger domain-containing protein [Hexamita inflata]|uniref:E3 ubiquitin-protein ligase n=1 Tax=Hexamita inflata TaxID=28002 RepID=A0AA86NHU0_9EUKA|nr:Putative zinc finger in N-recognin (UBR box) and ring finger domain-containing protein [Hexamita inflata]